ncbi:hypothetical protein [Hymenobacter baengnokdamensis]|uniref:hypothetical protein n=1 Tax=Hymenobacter baengnokdamensis TaxID=2615203 RepID=UPI001245E04B|nr:hypothetical protein [Hymenobacter baengnokdamensis]
MPKLTQELRAGLTALAAELPAQTYLIGEVVSGQQLLDENPGKTKLTGGGEVDPKQTYKRLGNPHPVNHARRLLRAFERAGRAGVLAYCKPHIEPANFGLFSTKLSELVPAK